MRRTATWCGAHPRLRGEHTTRAAHRDLVRGSSPLTRGAQVEVKLPVARAGLIPAYAGSTFMGFPFW